jgi:hypothetical protein
LPVIRPGLARERGDAHVERVPAQLIVDHAAGAQVAVAL